MVKYIERVRIIWIWWINLAGFYSNSYELLKIAFDSSPGLRKRFSIDKIISFLDQAQSSSYFSSYAHILEIINIGLLEAYFFKDEEFQFATSFENTIIYSANNKEFKRKDLELSVFGNSDDINGIS